MKPGENFTYVENIAIKNILELKCKKGEISVANGREYKTEK